MYFYHAALVGIALGDYEAVRGLRGAGVSTLCHALLDAVEHPPSCRLPRRVRIRARIGT